MLVIHAVSKRPFSIIRHIKTYYLCTSMTQTDLNSMMILCGNKEMTNKLSLIIIINQFVRNSDHRLTFLENYRHILVVQSIMHGSLF